MFDINIEFGKLEEEVKKLKNEIENLTYRINSLEKNAACENCSNFRNSNWGDES